MPFTAHIVLCMNLKPKIRIYNPQLEVKIQDNDSRVTLELLQTLYIGGLR